MDDSSLYFIGLIPSGDLQLQLHELKQDISIRYKTYHALKSPPHITLIPPFWCPNDSTSNIAVFLKDFAASFHSFKIALDDFGSFDQRVVYVRIQKNTLLTILQKSLSTSFMEKLNISKPKEASFHPHITLAFKDLTLKMFQKVWEKYENERFQASMDVGHLYLLKHNKIHGWKEEGRFPLLPT